MHILSPMVLAGHLPACLPPSAPHVGREISNDVIEIGNQSTIQVMIDTRPANSGHVTLYIYATVRRECRRESVNTLMTVLHVAVDTTYMHGDDTTRAHGGTQKISAQIPRDIGDKVPDGREMST